MSESDHAQFDEAVAAYSLGALDEAERVAFERHLVTCEICQYALGDFDRVNAALAIGGEPAEPPASLKARTLARAAATEQLPRVSLTAPNVMNRGLPAVPARRGMGVLGWLATAAAVLLIAGLSVYAVSLHAEVTALQSVVSEASARAESLRAELVNARRDSARLTNTIGVISAPDLVRVDLRGAGPAAAALGRAYLSRAHGLVISVAGLPALPAGRIYQLWVIPHAAAPVSAGVFGVDPAGGSTISVPLPPAAQGSVKTVAVTIEPGPNGSPGPTSAIVLAGSVAGD